MEVTSLNLPTLVLCEDCFCPIGVVIPNGIEREELPLRRQMSSPFRGKARLIRENEQFCLTAGRDLPQRRGFDPVLLALLWTKQAEG